MCRDVPSRPLDQRQRQLVARLVVVRPVDQPVLPHDEAARLWVPTGRLPHDQTQVEPRPLPADVGHIVAVDLPRQPLRVRAGRDRDRRVRVRVVDVLRRQERVQRRVDAARPRVQVERRVRVQPDHLVLDRRFRPSRRRRRVPSFQCQHPIEVQRGKIFPLARPQVAAGPLDPQHLYRLAGQRVDLGQLRARVPTAGVGHPLVGPEQVAPVDEPADRVERRRRRVVPAVGHEVEVVLISHVSRLVGFRRSPGCTSGAPPVLSLPGSNYVRRSGRHVRRIRDKPVDPVPRHQQRRCRHAGLAGVGADRVS